MRITLLSALCLLLAAGTASAAATKNAAATDTVKHTSSASEHYGSSTKALGIADTENVTTGESLSGMFNFGDDWLQVLAAVNQTKGSFSFAVGGIYKFTVSGTARNGFHIGPGATLGTVADDFAFAVFGACGGHFTVADKLLFSVDGGPMLTHTKDNTNFRLRALGPVIGASVHYIF